MAKVSFNNNKQVFYSTLKKSVDQYFTSNNLKKTGNWKLYLKTVILIPLALLIYVILLFTDYAAWVGASLSILLGLTLVSIALTSCTMPVMEATAAASGLTN
jgi:linoleoyl-CoA desaturase